MIKNKETKKEKVVKAKEDETKMNIDERNLRVAKVFSKKVKLVEEAHELGRKRNENELAVDSKSLQMRFKKSAKCVRRGKPRKRLEQKEKITGFFSKLKPVTLLHTEQQPYKHAQHAPVRLQQYPAAHCGKKECEADLVLEQKYQSTSDRINFDSKMSSIASLGPCPNSQ